MDPSSSDDDEEGTVKHNKNAPQIIGLFPTEPAADWPSYTLSEADKLLDSVYGDHYHDDNPGTHLCGAVSHSESRIQDLEIESSLRGDFVHAKTDEQRFRSFNATVLNGKLCSTVLQLTDRDGGRVFSPDDPCTKTGRPVLQILQEKHPMPQEATHLGTPGGAFEPYPTLPSCMGPQISSDMAEVVGSKLSGAAGPDGVDSSNLCA